MSKIKALLKSKNFIYILLALFSLFLACMSKDYDYDLYARLIVGEHFFKTGWITYEDFLSYTPTHLWYDHEWGSSIVFYAFFKLFGNFGLILVQAITLFLTSFWVIKTQKLQKNAYPISIFFMASFLALFSHQNPHIVRCHMFSFMFFSMLIYFLEKTRLQDSNILWLFLPIVIIWNNLHGGIVSGLGIIFIYMIGEILSRKPWLKYFLVLLISTPLLAINPYGIDYLQFLISANTKNRYYVTEWWDVFAKRHVIYYYPLFGVSVFTSLVALSKFFNKPKANITKTLVLLTTTFLGIIHVKLLSLPLIIVASLFYNEIINLFSKNSIKILNKFTYFACFLAILYIPFTNPTLAKTDISKYPTKEVEFIKQNKIKGNILTHFELGSYVSYKLYPQNLIYMDGRYEEAYYDEEFNWIIDFEKVNITWDFVLEEYPTDIVLLAKKSLVYKKMITSETWEEIYCGDHFGVFVRKSRKTHKLKLIKPSDDYKYYQDNEFKNFGNFEKLI